MLATYLGSMNVSFLYGISFSRKRMRLDTDTRHIFFAFHSYSSTIYLKIYNCNLFFGFYLLNLDINSKIVIRKLSLFLSPLLSSRM